MKKKNTVKTPLKDNKNKTVIIPAKQKSDKKAEKDTLDAKMRHLSQAMFPGVEGKPE